MNYGVLSIVPAILVIAIAIRSRRTTEALLGGCLASYLIIAIVEKKNLITLMTDSFFSVIMDYDTIWLVIVCGLFGSLVAVISASNGTQAIARMLGRICNTEKSVLLASWLLGIIIFVDDYMNIMTISVCTGVFYEQSEIVALGYGDAMTTYIHAIPYMFYAIVTVVIVPLFAIGIIPRLGAMKAAYKRTAETGQVYSKSSEAFNKPDENHSEKGNSCIWDFIIPIAVMIIIQLVSSDMLIAVIAAILTAAVLYIPRKKIRAGDFCNLWVKGFADSVPALMIIVAALWMRQASADLNLPDYVISIAGPFVSARLYPMIAFIVVAALGFVTGSNWGIPAVWGKYACSSGRYCLRGNFLQPCMLLF